MFYKMKPDTTMKYLGVIDKNLATWEDLGKDKK